MPAEKWLKYILDHPEEDWDWDEISENPNVTLDMVERHTELPWSRHLYDMVRNRIHTDNPKTRIGTVEKKVLR